MISSRNLDQLHPTVEAMAKMFIAECADHGIDILITSTFRDKESQDALYAQGRTVKGPIVTNAKGGQSFHNYRLAFDFVPIKGGKCLWNDYKLFVQCGEIAEAIGLEWAGRWHGFKEVAHCQYTGGLTLADLQNGKMIA